MLPPKLVTKEEYRQYYTYQTDWITILAQGLIIPRTDIRYDATTLQKLFYSLPNPAWVLHYRSQDNRCYYVIKSSLGSLPENLWNCLIKMALNQLLQNKVLFIFPFISSKHVPVSFFWFILDSLPYPRALHVTILQRDQWLLMSLFSVLIKQLVSKTGSWSRTGQAPIDRLPRTEKTSFLG